jgi:GNAT superfamily N-acetyltransferase
VARSEADRGRRDDVTLAVERADAKVSLPLQRAFFADMAERYPGWVPASSQSVQPSDLAPPNGVWLVAYLDQRAVGYGGLQRLDTNTAEIRRLFLDDIARGRGIGRTLLAELESHARRFGYERVRLTTGDGQAEAMGDCQARPRCAQPLTDRPPEIDGLGLLAGATISRPRPVLS